MLENRDTTRLKNWEKIREYEKFSGKLICSQNNLSQQKMRRPVCLKLISDDLCFVVLNS